jgi:hypothetical protein
VINTAEGLLVIVTVVGRGNREISEPHIATPIRRLVITMSFPVPTVMSPMEVPTGYI